MTFLNWFNHRRLHATITDRDGDTTPEAHEADNCRQTRLPSRSNQ
jgi:hypothetical protein